MDEHRIPGLRHAAQQSHRRGLDLADVEAERLGRALVGPDHGRRKANPDHRIGCVPGKGRDDPRVGSREGQKLLHAEGQQFQALAGVGCDLRLRKHAEAGDNVGHDEGCARLGGGPDSCEDRAHGAAQFVWLREARILEGGLEGARRQGHAHERTQFGRPPAGLHPRADDGRRGELKRHLGPLRRPEETSEAVHGVARWLQRRTHATSTNVTLLISCKVVIPANTRCRAESRRKVMPSSRAAFLISDAGRRARMSSRT